MAWVDLQNNQIVDHNSFYDALNNGVFPLKSGYTIPPGGFPMISQNNMLTKQNILDSSANINTTDLSFSNKAANQLVIKSDLLGNVVKTTVQINWNYDLDVLSHYVTYTISSTVVVDVNISFTIQVVGNNNTLSLNGTLPAGSSSIVLDPVSISPSNSISNSYFSYLAPTSSSTQNYSY